MIKGEYIGASWQALVSINGKTLWPDKSLAVKRHSPTGFAWGYYGSGPAQLALAILLELTDENTALRLYQQFKEDVIAKLPGTEGFSMSVRGVLDWVEKHKGEENVG